VRTDDAARAVALARARGFDPSVTEDGLVARLTPGDDARAASAALNRALVEADIAVFAIGPRARTLEGIYRNVSAPPVPATAAPQPEYA
jgi:ABC-2 type transport system ATP-binding protein